MKIKLATLVASAFMVMALGATAAQAAPAKTVHKAAAHKVVHHN